LLDFTEDLAAAYLRFVLHCNNSYFGLAHLLEKHDGPISPCHAYFISY